MSTSFSLLTAEGGEDETVSLQFYPCSVTLFFTVRRGLYPVLLEELPFSCIAKDIAYFLVSYSIVPFCKRSIIIFQCLVTILAN